MAGEFLIPFRETLEATLIIGVILAYLNKTGSSHLNRHVYSGTLLAILASILTAVLFNNFFGGLEGNNEKLFEGVTMLLAAAVLTYVIFWMASQKRFHQRIEEKVERHRLDGKALGLFAMSFFAVYREGVETVLFMGATLFAAGGNASLLVSFSGILAAVLIGYLVFRSALRFKLKDIFNASSILLLLFAAGLVAHGVHEFQEVGVLPTLFGKVWDTNWILDEKSTAGTLPKALFGYNGDPLDLEALSYFLYLALVAGLYVFWFKPATKNVAPAVAASKR